MATVTDPIMLDSTGQAIKDSIDLLTANINRTASNIPYDSNLTIKAAIDSKVSKSGDTMTGGLIINRQNANSELELGNSTNSRGVIIIYSNNDKYSILRAPTDATSIRNIFLPDNAGTLALTSDVDGTTIDVDPITSSGNPRSTNIVNKSRISGKQVIINVTFESAINATNSPGMVYIKSNTPKIFSALSCVRLASNGDIEAVVGAYSLTNGTIYVKEVTNGSKYVLTGCYAID